MRKDKLMAEVLRLAALGRGRTSPNPMVGAVVVNKGKIVGRGYHQKAGSPHAEVIALKKAGKKSQGATLYTNLEPCCHFGKTPPCTEAIIRAGIKSVVYSIDDPNPRVNGKGRELLKKAGIQVHSGLMEAEASQLNQPYIKKTTTGYPLVEVLISQTIDGKIPLNGQFDAGFNIPGMKTDALAMVRGSQVQVRLRLNEHNFTFPVRYLRRNRDSAREFLRNLAAQGLNSVLFIGSELSGNLLKHSLVDRICFLTHPYISSKTSALPVDLGIRKLFDAIQVKRLTLEKSRNLIVLSVNLK